MVSIVTDLSIKLKKASIIGEECRDSVPNVTTITISSCEGQIICHPHWIAVGKRQDFQFKRYFE